MIDKITYLDKIQTIIADEPEKYVMADDLNQLKRILNEVVDQSNKITNKYVEFTNTDLLNGSISITHNLDADAVSTTIFDSDGIEILSTTTNGKTNRNVVVINLDGLTPITGTWSALIIANTSANLPSITEYIPPQIFSCNSLDNFFVRCYSSSFQAITLMNTYDLSKFKVDKITVDISAPYSNTTGTNLQIVDSGDYTVFFQTLNTTIGTNLVEIDLGKILDVSQPTIGSVRKLLLRASCTSNTVYIHSINIYYSRR